MKRIIIALIVMLAAAAIAVSIFFTARYYNNENAEESASEAAKLVIFDFDPDAATALKIHNESGDYEMQYTNENGWQMITDVDFEVNYDMATYICSAMSPLSATRIIEDADPSKFGFDNSVDLTVTANGKDHTLHIGDVTPTTESFYVMKEGSDCIYLIDYQKGLTLDVSKDGLKNHYIADFHANQVNHFALWNGSENDDNILFSMYKDESGIWSMVKPYQDSTVYVSDVNVFVNAAIRDEIYGLVKEGCEPSEYEQYGFDNPQYVFEISTDDKYVKVIFGDNTNNDTEMYGLFTETGQVVTFSRGNVAILGYKTSDMMNKYFCQREAEEISSVDVTLLGYTAKVTIDAANEKQTVNGKDIDHENSELFNGYLGFFEAFNNVYFESVDKDQKPSGEAEVTVKYTLIDGTETTIEYIPVPGDDSNTYWAMKNGEYTGFIVRKKVVANIISKYEILNDLI